MILKNKYWYFCLHYRITRKFQHFNWQIYVYVKQPICTQINRNIVCLAKKSLTPSPTCLKVFSLKANEKKSIKICVSKYWACLMLNSNSIMISVNYRVNVYDNWNYMCLQTYTNETFKHSFNFNYRISNW